MFSIGEKPQVKKQNTIRIRIARFHLTSNFKVVLMILNIRSYFLNLRMNMLTQKIYRFDWE